MKIIETRPRVIDFVLWGHCQTLLDDPRIGYLNRIKLDSLPTLAFALLQNCLNY